MNIELQVKMLYANADKLDEAGFVADFYYIAKEYARQQLLQQTPCTTLRGKVAEMLHEVTDVMSNDNVHPMSIEKLSGEKRVLQKILKLIDESLPGPVA